MLSMLYLFFGYATSYVGYCIGYISNVLLFVAWTPNPKHTTAPGNGGLTALGDQVDWDIYWNINNLLHNFKIAPAMSSLSCIRYNIQFRLSQS